MKKIIVFAGDYASGKGIVNALDKTKYVILEASSSIDKAFSYCLRQNPEILIFHTAYLNGNYMLFDQLLNTNRFKVLYISTKLEYGALYNVLTNPRFHMLAESKTAGINDILEIMDRDVFLIEGLQLELQKYKDIVEEEKLVRKAKLVLIQKKGISEEEAYKMILKKSMDQRVSKLVAAKKILEEVIM